MSEYIRLAKHSAKIAISTAIDSNSDNVKFPNKSPKKNTFDLTHSQKNDSIDRCLRASSMKFDPNTFSGSPPNSFMEDLTQRMSVYYSDTTSA